MNYAYEVDLSIAFKISLKIFIFLKFVIIIIIQYKCNIKKYFGEVISRSYQIHETRSWSMFA